MPINLLFIIQQMAVGGTEKQLAALIQGLDRRFFRPHLCTLRSSSSSVDRLDIPKIELNVRQLVHPKTLMQLKQLIVFCRGHRIHLIQTFFQDPTIIGAMVKMVFPVKLVGSFRDMGFWRTPKESWKMRLAYPMFDGFIANSQAVKAHFCSCDRLSSRRISVIYNGIPAMPAGRTNESKDARDELNVGVVGNFNRPVKRIQDFIKASALVARDVPDARFTLVGGGDQEMMLRQMAADLGTADKTRFVGRVDDAMPYIETLDVGVNTSASEGFSNAIIEYMAVGRPVVATDVGGNRELIEHGINGYLYPAGDFRQAAVWIIRLLQDSILRHKMGDTNRRRIAADFTYEKMINGHQAYYRKLICAAN
jgi:L-malate glycosyltransferase